MAVSSVTGAYSTTQRDGWDRKTIIVQGLHRNTPRDTIKTFFENQSQSGGGVTKQVDFDVNKGVAYVTFLTPGGQSCIQLYVYICLLTKRDRRTLVYVGTYTRQHTS